jgi:hypothetical protein
MLLLSKNLTKNILGRRIGIREYAVILNPNGILLQIHSNRIIRLSARSL